MGTYNSASGAMKCPRCGNVSLCHVELKFGDTSDMSLVGIGEAYPFNPGKAPQNGGELDGDNPVALGYTECEICGRDYHCDVWIEDGSLASIKPCLDEPPLCPDEEAENALSCPQCGNPTIRLQVFDGYSVCRMICDSAGCYLIGIAEIDEKKHPKLETMRPPNFPIRKRGEQGGGDQSPTR